MWDSPRPREAIGSTTSGDQIPVFTTGALTFGILICNDSNFLEPARILAAKGAAALFIPTNNALPQGRAAAELAAEARSVDIARAIDNCGSIIRADVSGRSDELEGYGSSEIVDFEWKVLQTALALSEALLVADSETKQRPRVNKSIGENVPGSRRAAVAHLPAAWLPGR